MKIITIVGARPQFVKAAVVSRAFKKSDNINEILVHTGQHFDTNMSDIFFSELEISAPHYNLGIGGGTHGQNTGRMLEKIEEVILQEKPDWLLVYGDTDSTLAGVLAASKLHIPVAHVEAGLRSFNRLMPEEINRVVTDHVSSFLFAPTETAVQNLKKEGLAAQKIKLTGDVMYDAALYYGKKAYRESTILNKLKLTPKQYILATIHRAENTNSAERLQEILICFSKASLPIVWPIHPRTHQNLIKFGLDLPEGLHLIDPVGYLDMVMLERNSKLIATDSGGIQKEAFFHCVPCLTLRTETEWVELVDAGVNQLTLTPTADDFDFSPSQESFKIPLYGTGDSASEIAQYLRNFNGA